MKSEASRIHLGEQGSHSRIGSMGARCPALCQALSGVPAIEFLPGSFWRFCGLKLVFRPFQG